MVAVVCYRRPVTEPRRRSRGDGASETELGYIIVSRSLEELTAASLCLLAGCQPRSYCGVLPAPFGSGRSDGPQDPNWVCLQNFFSARRNCDCTVVRRFPSAGEDFHNRGFTGLY